SLVLSVALLFSPLHVILEETGVMDVVVDTIKEETVSENWDNAWENAGELEGYGDFIIKSSMKHNVDPRLVSAIILYETNWGNSPSLVKHNNPLGVLDPKTEFKQLKTFNSLEIGLDASIKSIAKIVHKNKVKSIEELGEIYAPSLIDNITHQNWVDGVEDIYSTLEK